MDNVKKLYQMADNIEKEANKRVEQLRSLAGNISHTKRIDNNTLNLLSNNEKILGNDAGMYIMRSREDALGVADYLNIVHCFARSGDPLCKKIFDDVVSDPEGSSPLYILMNSPIPSQMVLRTMSGHDYDAYLNGEKSISGPKHDGYFLK